MQIDSKGLTFPLTLSSRHGLDLGSAHDSVRAMLEQILFTMPGERINRPTFGVGVQRYVFAPNSPFIASEIRVALDENVYEHLGRNVRVLNLDVRAGDLDSEVALHIFISFEIIGTLAGPQDVEIKVPREGGR